MREGGGGTEGGAGLRPSRGRRGRRPSVKTTAERTTARRRRGGLAGLDGARPPTRMREAASPSEMPLRRAVGREAGGGEGGRGRLESSAMRTSCATRAWRRVEGVQDKAGGEYGGRRRSVPGENGGRTEVKIDSVLACLCALSRKSTRLLTLWTPPRRSLAFGTPLEHPAPRLIFARVPPCASRTGRGPVPSSNTPPIDARTRALLGTARPAGSRETL